MTRLDLRCDPLRLEVDPALGGAVTGLWLCPDGARPTPLLRPTPGFASHFDNTACYLLAPWVNRLPGGVLDWRGERHVLRANWPDPSAIHGDVHSRPWRILDRSPVSAHLGIEARDASARNWPWAYGARVRYELGPDFLECALEVRNLDTRPMPAGLGFHPYFQRALWHASECPRVTLACTGRYPLRACIPTGPARDDELCRALRAGALIDDLVARADGLDDVFAGFDGKAEILWPASGVRASFACSDAFGHAVIYAPRHSAGPSTFFTLEPVSTTTNAAALEAAGVPGTGLRTLAPGEALRATWRLTIARV
ncbi:MAG: hypothetical protein SFY69_05775 [Planctomycetota bacterium]|nr:hypothetical protein [Planctomycetota bacterium]